MKLSNFRIRQRIHPKLASSQVVDYNQPTQIDQTIPKKDQLKLSSLLHSFQNIITNLVNSNNIKNTHSNDLSNHSPILPKELEYRDRFVSIDLPDFSNDNIELEKLEPWIGLVCEQSLSVAFCYFLDKKMNYDQMKAFASESLLRNIVNLADHYHLTPEVFRFIDQTMNNRILPFLKAKYPLAVEKLVNKALQSAVKSVDNSEIISNNYFFTSDICFEFRESGRYDDVIMKLLNELMERTDKPSLSKSDSQLSNYKQFENMMTQIFQKSFDEEWMESKDHHSNGLLPQKNQKEKQKYEQKVRKYTDYLIGRKISENTPIYTQDEIKSQYLSIKSPAILRILTKWCDELWSKFQNENYFIERTDGLLLIESKKIGLVFPWIKQILKKQMMKEKEEIQAFMKEIQDINYKQQVHLLQNQIENPDNLYLQKHQRISGKFACKIVNNVQSFIVDYLNRLIHGLTKVSKVCFKQIAQFKEYWPSPFNLVTFNVSDLLRCKYSSKQKEVLSIFKEISRMANENPEKFKIIKIKNRLKDVTNDIMVIAKLNNTINCEIQIAVNNSISQFINCSNKINHYIYELERSTFGPILQLCSIWKSCEKRSEMFNKLIEGQKPKRQINRIEKGECSKNTKDHELIQETKPFICSECSKHYYHNNFIVSHKKCKLCEYWKCARCLIFQNFEKENKAFFFSEDNLNNVISFCKNQNQIPKYGACIFINRPTIELNYYMKMQHNFKEYLINKKNDQMAILKQFKSKKQVSQFFKQCLVFNFSQQKITQELKINQSDGLKLAVSSLFIPEQLSDCLRQQKETLSTLRQDHFTQVNFQKIYSQCSDKLKFVQSIQFSSCVLKELKVLTPGFVNLKRLNLNINQLTGFPQVCQFKKLEKLYINENRIANIPPQIGDLKQIKEIYLYGNSIKLLPQSFSQLTQLTVLNLSRNQFEQVPQSFIQLQKLRQLDMKNNKFTKFPAPLLKLKELEVLILQGNSIELIPDQIDQLVALRELNLNRNKITVIPEQIERIMNVRTIQIADNSIETLPQSFFNLKKLQKVNLYHNKLKQIPEGFGGLQMLKDLNLSDNQIIQWNSCLFNLSQLTSLNVGSNQISVIQDNFDKLKKLKVLDIGLNKLIKIPDSVLKMKALTNLIYRGNLLEVFDIRFITRQDNQKTIRINNQKPLKQITCQQVPAYKNQILNFEICQTSIQKVPEFLFEFNNLQSLRLNNNQITEIPDKFGNLLKLKILTMNFNLLQTLPKQFSRIQTLEQLFLTNNKIEQFPPVICQLNNLKKLNLNQNKIKSIPDSLKALSLLQTLLIQCNQIELIPDFIGEMVMLKSLNLSINKVKQIPQNLFKNTGICQLLLISNLIEVVPSQICQMVSLRNLKITQNPIKQIENEEAFTKKFPRSMV